jgi:D-alanine-D-alanine ligase-like ATP-grasp enzyme
MVRQRADQRVVLEFGAAIVAALPGHFSRPLRLLVLANTIAEYRRQRSQAVQRTEQQRAAFYDRVWREAASHLGAYVKTIPENILEIGLANGRTRVHLNETAADDIVTLRLAADKLAVHRLVEAEGIPMPACLEFRVDAWRPAETFLSRAEHACVVKPAHSGSGGLGVTTGVRDRRGLVLAIARAAVFGLDLLIEHEVEGRDYRLLFLDGVLLDAFARFPPTVRGDGSATVAELVRRENVRRLALGSSHAQTILNIDSDMLLTLRRQGLALRSVPSRDRVVIAKKVVNDNAAHQNDGVRGQLAEPIVRTARSAAAAVGVRFAGVDIITRDPSRPLEETGGVVLEVNTTPGLYHHYQRNGEPAAVAVPILAALLAVPILIPGGSARAAEVGPVIAAQRSQSPLGVNS